ncbi:MAG: 4-(cytidine 5'-diphospho)-2-C-methyl-D-erythritol kinase, partial [Pseudomonadota bacterium]
MAVEALTSDAFAKVNLTLRITGRLADGYHTLESLVMFALVADQLTLQPGCDLSLSIAGTCPAGLGGENNLILRAARALAEQVAGLRAGHFILNKRLPIAAGIGGGSADAAAALRLLAGLNGLALHDPRLQAAARATGADVPACLLSEPLVMRGIGEILSQRGLPDVPVVLVNPGIDVSTVEVFTALDLPRDDRIRGGDAPDIPNTFGDLIAALKGM